MGKKGPKQRVTAYRMSIHLGLCAGPVDELHEIYVSEKPVGDVYTDRQAEILIDKQDLFGGIKKEGGLYGKMTYLPGDRNQYMTAEIAAKFGKTPTTMEGYRGVASLFFAKHPAIAETGFYWTANSPYLRDIWAKITRLPKGWYPEKAGINSCGPEVAANGSWEVTGIDFTQSNSSRHFDIYDDSVVSLNAAHNAVVIRNARAGDVRATIAIDYTVIWVYISGSQNQVLVLDDDGTVHVYDLQTGAAQTPLTGTGDPAVPGDPLGSLVGAPNEIVVSGDTYVFFGRPTPGASWATVCLKNHLGVWSFAWASAYGGIFGTASAAISASPLYLVSRGGGGGVRRANWNPLTGTSGTYEVDFYALLGWHVTSSDLISSITYSPDRDVWFVCCAHGKVATLNSDFTAVIASDSAGGWIGTAPPQYVQTRRIFNHRGYAVFTEVDSTTARFYIYTYDIMTCEQISRVPLTDWDGFDAYEGPLSKDSGFATGSKVLAIVDNVESAGAYVLQFPLEIGFDANPVHIIVEALTNKIWGMGGSLSQLNVPAFVAAADTLYTEKLGLSMIWVQQAKIEDFVGEVLNHIEGNLFINPRTGLFEIKLIRNDYDPSDLPILDKSNSTLIDHQIKLYGEGVNEIVVTWTNPENEKEETVTLQDPGAIAAQDGSVVSDSRNYYGVRCQSRAMALCERDLRAATAPLASATVETGRTNSNLTPGSVVKLNFPEHNVNNRIMRVGPVNYGDSKTPFVKLSLVEDVFSTPEIVFEEPTPSEWTDPSETPVPIEYTEVITLPAFLVAKLVDDTAAGSAEYPEVFAGVLAAQLGEDTGAFELLAEVADSLGNLSWESVGSRRILSRATTGAALASEAQSVFASTDLVDATQGAGPSIGGLAFLGADDDETMEIVAISAFSSSNYTFERGVLDTTPKAWPIGTPIWFVGTSTPIHDNTARSAGGDVDYKILPTTSLGTLPETSASVVTETLNERPWLPLRPANVKIEGEGFALVDARLVDPVAATWAERNRTLEDTQIVLWGEATVTPEVDQTTTITIMDLDRAVLTAHSGLTGTSFDIPQASFLGETYCIVRFDSERDGLTSLQGHEIVVFTNNPTVDSDAFTADTDILTADNG